MKIPPLEKWPTERLTWVVGVLAFVAVLTRATLTGDGVADGVGTLVLGALGVAAAVKVGKRATHKNGVQPDPDIERRRAGGDEFAG